MNLQALFKLLTTFSIMFGLLLCIAASRQPMDVPTFLNGLLLMMTGTWVRVLVGETERD